MGDKVISSDKTFKANDDSKVKAIQHRFIIIKLQKELSKVLKKFDDENIDSSKTITNVNDLLIKTLSILSNFSVDLFRFEICEDNKAESLTVKPLNLISALWLRGIDVALDEIINDRYEDSMAVYFWEDNKMVVAPKDRRDLFSYEF